MLARKVIGMCAATAVTLAVALPSAEAGPFRWLRHRIRDADDWEEWQEERLEERAERQEEMLEDWYDRERERLDRSYDRARIDARGPYRSHLIHQYDAQRRALAEEYYRQREWLDHYEDDAEEALEEYYDDLEDRYEDLDDHRVRAWRFGPFWPGPPVMMGPPRYAPGPPVPVPAPHAAPRLHDPREVLPTPSAEPRRVPTPAEPRRGMSF